MTDTFALPYTVTEQDEVDEAIATWNEAQVLSFDFMCQANSIVGKRDGGTKRLADGIKHEVDTVERYAAGGALWLAMLMYYPSESETWREHLYPYFWVSVGVWFKRSVRSLVKQLDLTDEEAYKQHPEKFAAIASGARHWMNEALENGWTVEKLREMLPSETPGTSPFKRAMSKIAKIIEKDILQAPSLESQMSKKEYRQFMGVAKWLHKFITGKIGEK